MKMWCVSIHLLGRRTISFEYDNRSPDNVYQTSVLYERSSNQQHNPLWLPLPLQCSSMHAHKRNKPLPHSHISTKMLMQNGIDAPLLSCLLGNSAKTITDIERNISSSCVLCSSSFLRCMVNVGIYAILFGRWVIWRATFHVPLTAETAKTVSRILVYIPRNWKTEK